MCLFGNHLSCLRGFLVKGSVINKGVSQTDLAQIQILPLTNPKLFSPVKTLTVPISKGERIKLNEIGIFKATRTQ